MNALALRQALAKHLGKELTAEAAAAIFQAALEEPEQAIEPGRFEPARHGDYTIQVESYRATRGEIEPLHQAHWLETERYRHGQTLAVQHDVLEASEKAGQMLQFTVRCGGELVGHLRMFLGTSLHTGVPLAEEDTLFLRADHRGGFLAMHLLRYAERALAALGVTEIQADSKLINKADVLMKRMGYTQFALKFVKFLGESHV